MSTPTDHLGAALSVLVVEDDEGLAALLLRRLQRAGWIASALSTGREAVEAVTALAEAGEPLPLLLLDYRLPDMAGPEVVRHLRDQGLAVPFVAMTGFGGESVAVEVMKLGALDYLHKDGSMLDLVPMTIAQAAATVERNRRLAATERTLQLAAQEWQATFDTISDVVLVVDTQHRILRANAAAVRFTGRQLPDLLGASYWEAVHARTSPLPDCPLARLSVSHCAEVGELQRGDRWLRVTADPLSDASGELVAAVCLLSDITEVKRNEAALKDALGRAETYARESRILLDGAGAVLRHSDFATAARAIFDLCRGLSGATSGYVALLSDEGDENEVLFLEAGGLPCTVDPELPMPARGLREVAYRTRHPAVDNAFASSRWAELMPSGHVELRNVLFAPLLIDGAPAGLIGLANKPADFDDDDVRMVEALASLAAISLRDSRTLDALRAREAAYRDLYEQAPVAYFTLGAGGHVLKANRSALELTGLPQEELSGRSLVDLVDAGPIAGEHGAGLLDLFAAGRRQTHLPATLRRADGELRMVALSVQPLARAPAARDGATARVVLQDVTDQRLATVRIAHLNRVLQSIRKVGQLIVTVRERDPLLKAICNELTSTRGYHSAWIALVGGDGNVSTLHTSEHVHPCLSVHPELVSEQVLCPCGEVVLRGEPLMVVEQGGEAEPCWLKQEEAQSMLFARLQHEERVLGVLAVASPLEQSVDPAERALIGELADDVAHAIISLERKRARRDAETALAEQLSLLRALLDSIPSPIFYKDASGRYLGCNEAFTAVVGHPVDAVVGKTVYDIAPPGLAERYAAADAGLFARGGVHTYDATVQYADGSLHETHFTKSTFAHGGDAKGGLVGVMSDLSERRRLEAELRHAGKMQAMGRLAGGIAHEINTPLQFASLSNEYLGDAVGGLSRLLLAYEQLEAEVQAGRPPAEALQAVASARAEADLDYAREQIPKAFERVSQGLERVGNIVRSMRDFAHPDASRKELADLNRALHNTALISRAEYKRVASVRTEFAELPPVACHLGELNQVFLNLIVNAAQAIAARVGQSGAMGSILLRTRHLGGFVEVIVEDDGVGMPPSVRERAFEPFFTTRDPGSGTGQGLAVAHTIVVDRHGGDIELQSEPGAGTAVIVRLPTGGVSGGDPAPHERS